LTISPPAAPPAALPRVRLVPDGPTSAGSEAIDLAATAGLFLDPWQARVVEDFLTERADGKWAALECGLIVPRQNGKSRALEAIALHALFLDSDARLILWSAHQFKTAREAFINIRSMVQNTPHLMERVKPNGIRASHGEEGIELRDGSRLNFVARSRTSGRGFSGDRLILDEAQEIDPEDLASSLPMLSARPNPQIIYAGTVSPTAETLRRLSERGAKGEDNRLAVTEYGADPDCDRDDPTSARSANPSYGTRIFDDFIAVERANLTTDAFDQERLGIWPKPVSESSVVDLETWAELSDPDAAPPSSPVFAVDVAPDRSSTCISTAGHRDDGKVQVATVEHKSGTGWVVDRLKALCDAHGGEVVIDPGGAAGSLIAELERADVPLRLMRTRDVVQAFGMFVDACANDGLRHLGQPSLTSALAGAKKRDLTGGGSAWARQSVAVDITPLVAATNALWGVGTAETDADPSIYFL
jgi:hypothetical protein